MKDEPDATQVNGHSWSKGLTLIPCPQAREVLGKMARCWGLPTEIVLPIGRTSSELAVFWQRLPLKRRLGVGVRRLIRPPGVYMCPTRSLKDRHSSRSPRREAAAGGTGRMGPQLQSWCKMLAFPGCPSPVAISLQLGQVPLQGQPFGKVGIFRRLEGKRFWAGGRAVRGREGGRAGHISEEALQERMLTKDGVKAGCSGASVVLDPALPLPPPRPPSPPRPGVPPSWASEDG